MKNSLDKKSFFFFSNNFIATSHLQKSYMIVTITNIIAIQNTVASWIRMY